MPDPERLLACESVHSSERFGDRSAPTIKIELLDVAILPGSSWLASEETSQQWLLSVKAKVLIDLQTFEGSFALSEFAMQLSVPLRVLESSIAFSIAPIALDARRLWVTIQPLLSCPF